MLILDRQNQILQYVKNKRVARVAELANHFRVHEATIRRDLSLLEKEGKLRRTHGGVMIDDEIHSEPPFSERESVQYEEKRKIGQLAAEFIEDGNQIILDSGTTTLHIAEAIAERKNLTVITNDINIAAKLRFSTGIKVIVTGGLLYPESYILNGMITDEVLNKLHVHMAFIGNPAFHPTLGITHFDERLVPAKRAMIRSAKKTVVVCDHTKLGRVSLHTVAEVNEIDCVITGQMEPEDQDNLVKMGIDVRLAY